MPKLKKPLPPQRRSERSTCKRKRAENQPLSNKICRPCGKSGCFAKEPSCCLEVSESCCGSSYTSRWYHMSPLEHFCNNCFDHFYRYTKPGNKRFSLWSSEWSRNCRVKSPTLKCFIANDVLPYWFCCKICSKWRKVHNIDVHVPDVIENFQCSSCDAPADIDPNEVLNLSCVWSQQLAETPLLKFSPAAPFVIRFLGEDVGNCPPMFQEKLNHIPLPKYILPFKEGQCGQSSIWSKPYEPEPSETNLKLYNCFPVQTYLGIRNLLIVLWNLFPREWLTKEKVASYIIVRGISRIIILSYVEEVICYLMKKAIINYGIIDPPQNLTLFDAYAHKVIVIGAGVAGLAAAKFLRNLKFDVTVLEGRSHFGGRAYSSDIDASSSLIRGIFNNPFTIMSHQKGLNIEKLTESLIFFDKFGKVIPNDIILKMERHFFGILVGAIEVAQETKHDISWYDAIIENLDKLKRMVDFDENEEIVFNFLMAYWQINVGISLEHATTLNWEFLSTLREEDGVIKGGINPILEDLAKGLDIHYNTTVKIVDYSHDKVKIITDSSEFEGSFAIVTVPTSCLRDKTIKICPSLSDSKIEALSIMGEAYCEKVLLNFPKKFWSHKVLTGGRFGILSRTNIFHIFFDVTEMSKDNIPSLITFIPEASLSLIGDKEDNEVIDICISVLKQAFNYVPKPTSYHISKWKDQKFGGAYGTYIKVCNKHTVYDDMAETIDNKIYFAGDATFQNFPSSVTGAYLSGLREASKIIRQCEGVSEN